ncbi:ATP-binding protein [bacterium CPR1]|nr:ATP-binding protein [bacterium CPR1]
MTSNVEGYGHQWGALRPRYKLDWEGLFGRIPVECRPTSFGSNTKDRGAQVARADLLLDLVRAGTQGDQARFRKVVEALIAEERSKQHHILADHLSAQLRVNGNGSKTSVAFQRASDYFTSSIPQRTFTDLVLPEPVLEACREIVEEHHRREVLFSHSLEPRHRILLTGPPGNGKTSLAEALATELMVPFYRLRYEKVIGSYLGETAQRLANLFAEARAQHCVLFLDEFETQRILCGVPTQSHSGASGMAHFVKNLFGLDRSRGYGD